LSAYIKRLYDKIAQLRSMLGFVRDVTFFFAGGTTTVKAEVRWGTFVSPQLGVARVRQGDCFLVIWERDIPTGMTINDLMGAAKVEVDGASLRIEGMDILTSAKLDRTYLLTLGRVE